MDMRMPDVDGAETIRRIRARPEGKEVKIIATTASAFEEDRQQARQVGADDFLSKPFRESTLFTKIASLLHVRYEYAEETLDEVTWKLGNASCLTPMTIQILPPPLRKQLRQATLSADLEQMFALIEEAHPFDAVIAAQLRELATRFDYASILALLPPKDEENP
jgi:CheY-like chemotaxis protein